MKGGFPRIESSLSARVSEAIGKQSRVRHQEFQIWFARLQSWRGFESCEAATCFRVCSVGGGRSQCGSVPSRGAARWDH